MVWSFYGLLSFNSRILINMSLVYGKTIAIAFFKFIFDSQECFDEAFPLITIVCVYEAAKCFVRFSASKSFIKFWIV